MSTYRQRTFKLNPKIRSIALACILAETAEKLASIGETERSARTLAAAEEV